MWRILIVFIAASVHAYDRSRGEKFDVAFDSHEITRYRLTTFFEKYDSRMVAQVDSMLKEYRGTEDQMWTALEDAYGPENQSELTLDEARARLTNFYEFELPDMVLGVDDVLKEYEGKFNLLDLQLRKKYGVGFL